VAFTAAVVFVAVGSIPRSKPSAAEEQRAIYRACQTFVTSRLGTATTTDFLETADVLHIAPTGELPFEANQWRVRGTFVERAAADPPTPARFVCDVSTDGEVVKLLGVTVGD
jgi:hypothetical protein